MNDLEMYGYKNITEVVCNTSISFAERQLLILYAISLELQKISSALEKAKLLKLP